MERTTWILEKKKKITADVNLRLVPHAKWSFLHTFTVFKGKCFDLWKAITISLVFLISEGGFAGISPPSQWCVLCTHHHPHLRRFAGESVLWTITFCRCLDLETTGGVYGALTEDVVADGLSKSSLYWLDAFSHKNKCLYEKSAKMWVKSTCKHAYTVCSFWGSVFQSLDFCVMKFLSQFLASTYKMGINSTHIKS